MRPNGFWYRGVFRLVRDTAYDNSQARRRWEPPGAGRGVWAWAVGIHDLDSFYLEYGDRRFQALRPRRDARAWAISWDELNAYVCGASDTSPTYEGFDPERHLVGMEEVWARDAFGAKRRERVWQFAMPWAIFVEGPMRHRRPHRPRWKEWR